MPRFQFRLQQYLGIKEQIEDQKELEYAKALRKVEEEKALLNEMYAQMESAINGLRDSIKKAITPIDIRRYNNSIERLKHHIKVQIERLAAAEAFAEEKRQELVQAMKERKALETVKENSREEFLRETDIMERKEVDELVSFKYTDKLQAASH